MLSFLQQLQMAIHSFGHDKRQLRHFQETYSTGYKEREILK